MNKTELLSKIRAGRKQLEVTLARFTEEQLLAPRLHGNWSVKDLIAHFGFWEARIAALYEQLRRGEEPPAAEPPLDELNAQAYAHSQALSLDEVRREERAAYLRLLDVAVNASDDDLFNPQRFAGTHGRAFAELIEDNSCGHYEEHAPDLSL